MPVTLAEAIDAAPWTRYQIRTVILVALTILFDGLDQNVLAVTLPAVARDWAIDPRAFAGITALATFAMMIGSAGAGVLSDRIGRRRTLIAATFVYAVASLAGAGSTSMEMLGTTRCVAGVGLGAALTTAVVALAEHTPGRKRGVVIAVAILGVPVGGILAGALGAALIPLGGWQSVYLLGGALPICLGIAYLLLLPETPAFMLARDAAGLKRYFARMGVAMPPLTGRDAHKAVRAASRGNPAILLAPPYRRNTLLLWLGFFASLLISYHVIGWMPALMSRAGASMTLASASLSYISMGSLAGGIAASFLVYWVGSRIAMVGAAAFSAAIGLWLALTFDTGPTTPATLATLTLVLVGVSIINTLFYTLLPNVYPEAVRGVGIGFGMAIGRLGAVASAYVGAWGIGGGGARFFSVVAVASLAALVAFGLIDRHQPSARKAN